MRAYRKIAPFARLTLFIASCMAVLMYVDYRSARASVVERLLGFTQRMAPFLDDGRSTERPREIHVNGMRLWAAAGHTDQPPSAVRRFYADRYAGRGSAVDLLTQKLKEKNILPPSVTPLSQASFGDDERGGLAAIDMGQVTDLRAIAERLLRIKDGKLGEIGSLRYVYWEKLGSGGTRFLTVWTDDKTDLNQLLPGPDGDVPGRDVPNVPRYPGTHRILSADERGALGQMAVYAGAGSPELAYDFYLARLHTLGWQLDDTFTNIAARQGRHALRAERQGHEIVIDCSRADGPEGLTVSVLAMR
jgi:hypothetical protein